MGERDTYDEHYMQVFLVEVVFMDITFDNIIGKTILVGLTYYSKDDEFLEQKQFFGTIVTANVNNGITIQKTGVDEQFSLPPDLRSFSVAAPGEYRLRSTGEVISDPDLLTTWTIHKP